MLPAEILRAEDLFGVDDIAKLLGVTAKTARDKVVTLPDFPAPAIRLSQRLRRWGRAEVCEYLLSKNRAGR